MATFFAIFYVDDAYLVSHNPEFLQRVLDILINLLACVGLEINVQKTQTMICTPGGSAFNYQKTPMPRCIGG
jgi:hypothetical protein